MSKTERDLAADGSVDALDELFDDADFDDALDAALEGADAEVLADTITDDADLDDADVDDDEVVDAVDDVDDRADDVDDPELDDSGEDAVDDIDATDVDVDEADVDDDVAAEVDGDDASGDDVVEDAESSTEDESDDDYEFPEIVPATPDDAEVVDDPDAFVERLVPTDEPDELDAEEVAEEILEELRRADIDGPQVEMAPQDDTTAARRRPRRAVDYDPAPMPIPARVPRVLSRKPRVRKVTRVVRHVDPWSVFKIAIVAHLVLYIIVLTAGVLLWNVAHATGTVDNVERFFESFGWQSFEFNGGEIYHAAWIAGLFVVIGLTGMAVLLATLFNLITDLVGGVRFTVLEEEVVETRTSPLRRFVVRRPEPEVPARLSDQSGPLYREGVVDDTSANDRPSR